MAESVLDKRQMRSSFSQASKSYDAMASLQRKVGKELIKQVQLKDDALVLDVGCGTGFFTQQLQNVAGLQNIIALDIALPMLLKTQLRESCESVPLVCADAEQLPLTANSLDGVVSNLALQWCASLGEMFSEVQRVLRANGQFVFSTFGESALCELKAAWAEVDDYPHVNEFCSEQDIKLQLQKAGFKNIRTIKHTYLVKYANVMELMRELKGIGAHNVSRQRNKQLTSKGQIQSMVAAYPVDEEGQVTASFEIIYIQVRGK